MTNLRNKILTLLFPKFTFIQEENTSLRVKINKLTAENDRLKIENLKLNPTLKYVSTSTEYVYKTRAYD
jgi:regulator of replication initiation timing